MSPASEASQALNWVNRILADERGIVISARPLEVTSFEVDGFRMAYVFYESGLSVNVMYGVEDGEKRAVGFKLSDRRRETPEELTTTLQVRTPEVEAGRRDPRLLLRDQRRILSPNPQAGDGRGGTPAVAALAHLPSGGSRLRPPS